MKCSDDYGFVSYDMYLGTLKLYFTNAKRIELGNMAFRFS